MVFLAEALRPVEEMGGDTDRREVSVSYVYGRSGEDRFSGTVVLMGERRLAGIRMLLRVRTKQDYSR